MDAENPNKRKRTSKANKARRSIREVVAPGGPDGDDGVFFGAVATTAKGKERISQILEAALEIIVEDGFEGMTLRSVARKSGITIGNLQHYYPNHNELLQAVTRYILYHYFAEYDRLAGLYKDDIERQFEETIRFLINDCKSAKTNAIFFSLWAMAQRNPFVSDMMDLMYTDHRRSIEKLLAVVNPNLSPARVPILAALIATQIEGLMLLIAANRPKHVELEGIEEQCMCEILRMAHQAL